MLSVKQPTGGLKGQVCSLAYKLVGLQDNSPTNQLAVSQVADWITRGLVNSTTTNFKKNMELLYFICTLNLTLILTLTISNIGSI